MIRTHNTEDNTHLLNLIRLNTPQYFAPSEEAEFNFYLQHYLENYFVVEKNGQIIGSGGINYFNDKTEARISWDIIHPAFQGKGIGTVLTRFRLNHLRDNSPVKVVYVRTSQLVYPFYQKMGFQLEKTQADFWAPGLDLYQMKMFL